MKYVRGNWYIMVLAESNSNNTIRVGLMKNIYNDKMMWAYKSM